MFFFFIFSPTKSENRRVEQTLPRGEGWHWWEGGGAGQGSSRVNTCNKMCTHIVNAKMIPVEIT
jgi:hypothetical protein